MKYLASLLLSMVCIQLSAQYKPATEEQKTGIISLVKAASEGMTTMQCDFVQVKELSFMDEKVTSEGRMYFKKENRIRWEYLKPYKYVFILDGRNAGLGGEGDVKKKIPLKTSRLFRELSRVMTAGISGDGLVNSPDFSAQYMVGNDSYSIILTPLKKEISNLFSGIQLYINKSENRINRIEMSEKSGDRTVINLHNIKINSTVSDSLFNISQSE